MLFDLVKMGCLETRALSSAYVFHPLSFVCQDFYRMDVNFNVKSYIDLFGGFDYKEGTMPRIDFIDGRREDGHNFFELLR
jgi:hypothetical protein